MDSFLVARVKNLQKNKHTQTRDPRESVAVDSQILIDPFSPSVGLDSIYIYMLLRPG